MREKLIFAPIRSLFFLVVIGLIYTQVLRFPYYSRLSKDNAIRIIPIDGPRGTIFDRNGTPLVSNRISFNVAVVYQELRNKEKLIRLLASLLNAQPKDIEAALDKARKRPYGPVTIIEDIDKDKAFMLEEEGFNINGLVIQTKSARSYIYNSVGAHIFGYLSEISEAELESMKEYGYRVKDLIGRDGVEKHYDRFLSGSDGGIQIQVDNKGRHVKTLGFKEPAKGKDLYLTIDIKLQEACDALLEGRSGAVVVMNPHTGEILALSSSPSFDPNIFIKSGMAPRRLKLLMDEKRRPLLNRAVSGLYQPGSVFKVVTASGALESGRIKRGTAFNCGGTYTLGRGTFDCWKENGHGPQGVTDALMNSCNVFFYNAGRALGVDNLENFAKLFGFGRRTGIDLPDEARGLVPGRIWKRVRREDNWYEGDTINFAIGQGYLLVTPVQVLDMMAVMANKGSLIRPYLVKKIDMMDISNIDRKPLGLSGDTVRSVREGLYKVVNSENGTGKRAKLEGVSIAGKTGTAENPLGRTHAWFSGFAPFDNARICIVVFLEHGGKGGVEPSAIARDIFQEARNRGYL
jgi:penicillin-binding protein 2